MDNLLDSTDKLSEIWAVVLSIPTSLECAVDGAGETEGHPRPLFVWRNLITGPVEVLLGQTGRGPSKVRVIKKEDRILQSVTGMKVR